MHFDEISFGDGVAAHWSADGQLYRISAGKRIGVGWMGFCTGLAITKVPLAIRVVALGLIQKLDLKRWVSFAFGWHKVGYGGHAYGVGCDAVTHCVSMGDRSATLGAGNDKIEDAYATNHQLNDTSTHLFSSYRWIKLGMGGTLAMIP